AEPLQIIAHTVIENARCIGRSLDQLVGRLSACTERRKNDKASGERNALHAVPPNEFPARLFAGATDQQSSRNGKASIRKSKGRVSSREQNAGNLSRHRNAMSLTAAPHHRRETRKIR